MMMIPMALVGDEAAEGVVADGENGPEVQKARGAAAGGAAVGAAADADADAAVADADVEDGAVAVTAVGPVAGVEVGIEVHRKEGRLEAVGWYGVVEVAVFVADKENGVEEVPGEAVGAVTAAAAVGQLTE